MVWGSMHGRALLALVVLLGPGSSLPAEQQGQCVGAFTVPGVTWKETLCSRPRLPGLGSCRRPRELVLRMEHTGGKSRRAVISRRNTILGGLGTVLMVSPGGTSKEPGGQVAAGGGPAGLSPEVAEVEARKAASAKARKELAAQRKSLQADLKAFDEYVNRELTGLRKILLEGDSEEGIPAVSEEEADVLIKELRSRADAVRAELQYSIEKVDGQLAREGVRRELLGISDAYEKQEGGLAAQMRAAAAKLEDGPQRRKMLSEASRIELQGTRAPAGPKSRRELGEEWVEGMFKSLETRFEVLPPPSPRTDWTRRVPHPVLIGHAASLTPY